MSSSKLAYLSKYTTGGGGEERHGDKKKKKKKHKKTAKRDSQSFVHEVDLDVGMPSLPAVDEEEEDGEGPAVVVDQEQSYQLEKRNAWQEEGDSSSVDDHHRGVPSPRRRHDSSSSEESDPRTRRRRHDSDGSNSNVSDADSATRKRRRRHDSSAEEEEPPRRSRYDSDDAKDSRSDDEERRPVRTRHDSDDEDTESSSVKRSSRERMSSGHAAGLQQAEDFRRAESKLQRKRHEDAQSMVEKHGVGDTVYRDAKGRKVEGEVVQKQMRAELDEQSQKLLNKRRVQREREESHRQEMEELRGSSFARFKDDTGLEDLRRDGIREGDPMAVQAAKKRAHVMAASGRPQRPVYKGPSPKPNRYGIRPGYRWDGVDRGNGFEDKVLALKFSAQRKKENAYRWSSADM